MPAEHRKIFTIFLCMPGPRLESYIAPGMISAVFARNLAVVERQEDGAGGVFKVG